MFYVILNSYLILTDTFHEYLGPAVNRQPGYRRGDSQSSTQPNMFNKNHVCERQQTKMHIHAVHVQSMLNSKTTQTIKASTQDSMLNTSFQQPASHVQYCRTNHTYSAMHVEHNTKCITP